jgi:hypothetical protein
MHFWGVSSAKHASIKASLSEWTARTSMKLTPTLPVGFAGSDLDFASSHVFQVRNHGVKIFI